VTGAAGFFHLLLAIAVSIFVGYVVLTVSEIARTTHSAGWRVGACVEKLLPLVELSTEFKNFFDEKDEDPKNPKLSRRQKAFFAIYSLWGWALSFFLVGVLSSLSKN